MTGTYDWNPMPHKVSVCCPSCNELAVFEFAEVVRIKLKKDVPFFEDSNIFNYDMFKDDCGHKWHGAIYYAGLHGGSIDAISDLPEGYNASDWAHSKYLMRSYSWNMGSIQCPKCILGIEHELSWPNDAYFSISYKANQLWAFDRESTLDLRNYIAGSERMVDDYRWRNFLLHIPTIFKRQGARESVVKKLDGILSC